MIGLEAEKAAIDCSNSWYPETLAIERRTRSFACATMFGRVRVESLSRKTLTSLYRRRRRHFESVLAAVIRLAR